MKLLKWKTLFITCAVCLLPILGGVLLWDKLPDSIPIHFNMYNEADNFAGKGFAIFGLPILMMVLQTICCVIFDTNAYYKGPREKFGRIVKWIIPVLTVLLQAATVAYALGYNVDIRRVATGIVGCMFLILGNYLPKFDTIKNYNIDSEKALKINRFIGVMTVILGVLFLVSLFFPPIVSIVCLVLLIPYAAVSIVYGILVCKKK